VIPEFCVMIRLESISRYVRRGAYYTVPEAGAKVWLKRTQSYEAAKAGAIPTEQKGKFLLVPKQLWDRRVKRLQRGAKPRRSVK
jgi:hypothetical protein